jgi:hypothetical protein
MNNFDESTWMNLGLGPLGMISVNFHFLRNIWQLRVQ